LQPFEIILFTVFLIQFIYWVIFYFGISQDIKKGEAMNVPVSVIVCAHDEEENLRQLLPLLQSQQHSEFEIIIVNDCSNDGTYDFLREEALKDTRLKIVTVNNRPSHVNGKKYALTLGIKASKYDWVLLTDADCRPASTEWIHQMAGSFTEQASFAIGYSPYKNFPGLLNSFIRFETIITAVQFIAFAMLGKPYMATGRNLAYRKKIFLDNKGFHNHLQVRGGDDDLFVNQHSTGSNTRIMLSPKAIVISQPKKTWRDFYQQKIRHLAVGKRYKAGSRFMLAPFMITWLLFWPVMIFGLFTVNWPWVLGAFFVRWLTMIITIHTLNKKSGEEFEVWEIPFLDFIFCFYYLVAGLNALFTKRIRWKT
jgi:glycosyltransferase involved in cell wall biosynthesis